jgi:hypothetical protein
MKFKRAAVAACAAILATAPWPSTLGQEGHPLKGSWLGAWAGNETHGDIILVVLDWDGASISGTINPGTDNMALTKATLEADGWVVTLEADAQDRSGAAIHYVIEGKIENLELSNRSVVGTWRSERGSGAFEMTRQ